MAVISETELQRRLRALEKNTSSSGGGAYVGVNDPEGTNYSAGDSWYNTTTSNLWLFDGIKWDLSFDKLHLRYADDVENVDETGHVSSQLDVTGFSDNPFDNSGTQKTWRGIFFGPAVGSSDPTDYEWTYTAGETGYTPQLGVDYNEYFIHIKYSDDNGLTFTGNDGEDLGNYIGVLTDTNSADSETPADYTWAKFIPEKGVDYFDGIDADALTVSPSYNPETGETTLTFSDGSSATITDGAVGADGADGADGVDGESSGVVVIYADDANGSNASFTYNNQAYVNYYEWVGQAPLTVPSNLTYVKFIGEDGDSEGVIPIYADDASGTNATFTFSTQEYINFYEWTVEPPASVPVGLTYSKFVGDTGSSSYLHIKYSDDGLTFTGNNGEDLGSYIGTYVDTIETDSSTFSDYTWRKYVGDTPSFERYYTETAGLLSEIGDPDSTIIGVTWIEDTVGVPNTAYWIADRYTIDGVTSDWQVYPVQAKDAGIPFVRYELLGTPQPTLGDSTWISHAILAVEAYTGRDYTNQKEFGYGTVVVINYSDGTLAGKFTRVAGVDSWVAPGTFIDGDLIVDGTIAGDKVQANSITAEKLSVTDLEAVSANMGILTSGKIQNSDETFVLDLDNKFIYISSTTPYPSV